jgi:hypothetical protein
VAEQIKDAGSEACYQDASDRGRRAAKRHARHPGVRSHRFAHLRRQPLAALAPAAPQHVAPAARLHARAEPVRSGALALLRLVGPLHQVFRAPGGHRATVGPRPAPVYAPASGPPGCTRGRSRRADSTPTASLPAFAANCGVGPARPVFGCTPRRYSRALAEARGTRSPVARTTPAQRRTEQQRGAGAA